MPTDFFGKSVGVRLINWNLSDKYNQNNCYEQKNNSDCKFYYSYSSCIVLIFPSCFKIFFEAVDERIFLLEEDEVTE